MVEYISDPLKSSLTDANSYVRKTGVMAILKMWHLWPQAVEDGGMIDILYNMLQDTDAQVRWYEESMVWRKKNVLRSRWKFFFFVKKYRAFSLWNVSFS